MMGLVSWEEIRRPIKLGELGVLYLYCEPRVSDKVGVQPSASR